MFRRAFFRLGVEGHRDSNVHRSLAVDPENMVQALEMLLLSALPLRARLIREYTESLRLTSPEGLLAALPTPAFSAPSRPTAIRAPGRLTTA